MLLVIDANIIFSALIRQGFTFKIFLINQTCNYFTFLSPEYLFVEIEDHFEEIILKSKLSSTELKKILGFLKNQIKLIPFEIYTDKFSIAQELSPDEDDIVYFALALQYNIPFWSNDKKLRNKGIDIYSTPMVKRELDDFVKEKHYY